MRCMIAVVAALGLVGSGVAQEEGAAAAERRPNLLVIVTDDHPHDALGCAGHPLLRTPHLDALAASGTRFTRAFVTTPICAASRATLLTGQWERRHGYTFGQPPLDAAVARETYPTLLRGAGYRVGFVGKLGVRVQPEDRDAMFDAFADGTLPYLPAKPPADGIPPVHLTERNTERALEFLRAGDGRPFCLNVWFQAPHADDGNPDQYVWPASCDGLYEDVALPPTDTSDPAFFEALPEFLRTGLNRERWHWRFDTPEKRERMIKGYYRLLSGVDMAVGRLVAALDELGLREDTVILVIGDNGYFLGERGYAGKWTMHERSTRVPLIVVDPRVAADARGRVVDAFALSADVAPTLLALAGVPAPEGCQGRSLLPWLAGEVTPWRDEVFTEHLWAHPKIPRTEGLRTERWKFIRYQDHPEYEELYDLAADPREEHNLARDPAHAARRAELAARCTTAAAQAR